MSLFDELVDRSIRKWYRLRGNEVPVAAAYDALPGLTARGQVAA